MHLNNINEKASVQFQTTQHTPLKRTSKIIQRNQQNMLEKMESEISKLKKKIYIMNELKRQQISGKEKSENTCRDKVYDILKARNSRDKSIKKQVQQSHQNSGFKKNSDYKQDKKDKGGILNYISSKEKIPEFSHQSTYREKQDQTKQLFAMLINQNRKLRARVQQLEDHHKNLISKQIYFKNRFAEQLEKLQDDKKKQQQQSMYLSKLGYYYKTMALKFQQKLVQHDINIGQLLLRQSDNQNEFSYQ